MSRKHLKYHDKNMGRKADNQRGWFVTKIGLPLVLIAAVCIAVLITHWPTLSTRALSFDDYQYLVENVSVQNPSWESARRFLTEVLAPSTVGGYYQPLAMISLMLDSAIGGSPDNLRPYHRTSLLLHIINTALIIVLLYLLFDRIWIAAAAGALFGIHPMTVESVAWIGERKTLLAALFSLLSVVLYVSYVKKNKKGFYAGSLVTYILALMSKPTSTPLPLVMLLMDYWPLRRISNIKCQMSKLRGGINLILEKIPFFVIGAFSAVVTYLSQSQTAGTVAPSEYGPLRIPLVLGHNIVFYLYKIVWPVNLTSHYAFPKPLSISNPAILAGAIGTVVLMVLLIVSLRWTCAVLIGWLIFFVAMLPTMQIIGFSNIIASDKFAYLPSIGLLMIVTQFLIWLSRTANAARYAVITVTLLVLAGSETAATRKYLTHWVDTISLCRYMLKLTPEAASVHDMLGVALLEQSKFDEAAEHFRYAVKTGEEHHKLYNNLGSALQSSGKLDEAIFYYQQSLRIDPNYAKAHYNLGMALLEQGKSDEAIEQFHLALKSKPDYAEAHNNLGNILQSQGKSAEAIEHFRLAIKINPKFIEAYNNLANALGTQGRFDEAIGSYRHALQIKPNVTQLHYNLGIMLSRQGKISEAIACYERALSLAVEKGDEKFAELIRKQLETSRRK
jgi:Flp pilus assembly protein TadD